MIETRKNDSIVVEVVNPTAQATTNSYADVDGSLIDTLFQKSIAYTILNSDVANDLDWQVVASNDNDSFVVVDAESTVQEAAVDSYAVTQAAYRYYKVQVKSTVADTPAEATVSGIAK